MSLWLVTGTRNGIPFHERHDSEQAALKRHYELGDLGVEHPVTFPAGTCISCNRPAHIDDLREVAGCLVCPDCIWEPEVVR